jgi:acetolactate synthase-1/3 small subunit
MKRTLIALVENKPGVLNRVASLFRRRNYNIDSLTVGRTQDDRISRMTIVLEGDRETARIVTTNLYKLVNVIQVDDVTDTRSVSRDLALIKVNADRENRSEIMQLCDIYRAQIVDATPGSMVIEVTGSEEKITALLEHLEPIGIAEMVRTGIVTMARGDRVLDGNGYAADLAKSA